jgi:hypothetical protein
VEDPCQSRFSGTLTYSLNTELWLNSRFLSYPHRIIIGVTSITKHPSHPLPKRIISVRIVTGLACASVLYVSKNQTVPKWPRFALSVVTFQFLIAASSGYVTSVYFWFQRRQAHSKAFAKDISAILAHRPRGSAEKLLVEVLLFISSFILLAVTTPFSTSLSPNLFTRLVMFGLGYWLLLIKLDVHPLTSVFSQPPPADFNLRRAYRRVELFAVVCTLGTLVVAFVKPKQIQLTMQGLVAVLVTAILGLILVGALVSIIRPLGAALRAIFRALRIPYSVPLDVSP